jgi:hypothetical protein
MPDYASTFRAPWVSAMRILRFFLLAASIAGAAYIFHALRVGSFPGAERSVLWLFGLGAILNIIFLLFCGPIVTGNSRLTYLVRLWYDAKLRELKEHAGEPPRLD